MWGVLIYDDSSDDDDDDDDHNDDGSVCSHLLAPSPSRRATGYRSDDASSTTSNYSVEGNNLTTTKWQG